MRHRPALFTGRSGARWASPDPVETFRPWPLRGPERLIGTALQPGQDLIQQVDDLLQPGRGTARVVEQIRDRAKDVPEEVSRPLLRSDRQVNLVEVDHQPEQIPGAVARASDRESGSCQWLAPEPGTAR